MVVTAVEVTVVNMASEAEVMPMRVPLIVPPPIVALLLVSEAMFELFALMVVPEAVVK